MRRGYSALFLESSLETSLSNQVENQHITLEFGEVTPLPKELEKEFEVSVIAYGNDGENEGYLVELPEGIAPYFKGWLPHITVGLTKGAKAVDTATLDFKPLKKQFAVKARLGYFLFTPDRKGKLVYEL